MDIQADVTVVYIHSAYIVWINTRELLMSAQHRHCFMDGAIKC